jgi:hypothetical protein
MAAGELSYSKVRALTRVATPESGGGRLTPEQGAPASRDACACANGQGSPASDAPAAHSANPDLDRSDLNPGIRVSAETSRRLTCDASVVEVPRSPGGELLDFGRRTRTIPHWANGGATSLQNTLLLCRHHHRILHEGGWTLSFDRGGHPVFGNPLGLMATESRGTPITPMPRR